MKRKTGKQVLGLMLAATMMATSLTGCGSSDNAGTTATGDSVAAATDSGTSDSKYAEPLTIDVFDSQANFQGLQSSSIWS